MRVKVIIPGKEVDLVSTDGDNPSYWIQKKNGEAISNKYSSDDDNFADNYEELTEIFFNLEKAGV